ncbi:MAG: MAPEG family protein [Pseudomonadota bacterium]
MITLPVTLITACILGLLFIWLCIYVINGRVKNEALIGDAGNTDMLFRIRTHANFTEYVPIFLILLALLELHGGNRIALIVIAAVFVIARVLHILGMGEDANLKPRQIGIVGSFTGIIASSLYGLYLVIA